MSPQKKWSRVALLTGWVLVASSGSLWADVTGISIWQTAELSLTVYPPGGGGVEQYTRSEENTEFPARSLEVSGGGVPYGNSTTPARAKNLVSSYSGPRSFQDLSPSLTLRGTLSAYFNDPGIVHANSVQAHIRYVFSINEVHSYTFNETGAANLFGPGNQVIPVGFGSLNPGTYTLFAGVPYFNTLTPNFFETTYDLVVSTPEPTSAMIPVIAGLLALRRRRN